MPPLKKASKKTAAKHADPKHNESKDLRRAYEHLGRVELIQKISGHTEKDVTTLVALAQKELQSGNRKNAADLLRAAEHFSFAALNVSAAEVSKPSEELESAIQNEFNHLRQKAQDHWEGEKKEHRHAEVITLHNSALESADSAIKRGAYRQALELVRAAEALTHVKKDEPNKLNSGKTNLKLAVA